MTWSKVDVFREVLEVMGGACVDNAAYETAFCLDGKAGRYPLNTWKVCGANEGGFQSGALCVGLK